MIYFTFPKTGKRATITDRIIKPEDGISSQERVRDMTGSDILVVVPHSGVAIPPEISLDDLTDEFYRAD